MLVLMKAQLYGLTFCLVKCQRLREISLKVNFTLLEILGNTAEVLDTFAYQRLAFASIFSKSHYTFCRL